jgi:hypothetical protein
VPALPLPDGLKKYMLFSAERPVGVKDVDEDTRYNYGHPEYEGYDSDEDFASDDEYFASGDEDGAPADEADGMRFGDNLCIMDCTYS